MFNQTTLPMDVLVNPLAIQSLAIEELEQRLLGGVKIEDANSPFMFLMEMSSSGIADAINSIHNTLPSIYAARAQTSEDLYKHMSTWDYINMFSTPTSTTVKLTFDLDYIIEFAVDVHDTSGNLIPDYKKIMIPTDSIISIVEYKFGIYYPIEIRVKQLVGSDPSVLVLYNTDKVNPLKGLESNIIEHHVDNYQGVNLLSFDIPIYQFEKSLTIENTIPGSGFGKTYIYSDKFYAVRLYSYNGTDSNNDPIWDEMEQTLSNDIYDPNTLTAKIINITDENRLKIIIPQIYFTNNLMGSKLKLEIYTTKGIMDIDIIGISPESIIADFISDIDNPTYKYSKVLDRIPTINVTPTATKIQGGSNGFGIDELRQRVVSNTFYNDVLISNNDLLKFYADIGFNIIKYRDGVTDRVYYAYKEITDKAGNIIGTADIPTVINNTNIINTDSIIESPYDRSITILPSTLFRFNGVTSEPILNDELAIIDTMSNAEKIDKYNNDNFTITPYHIRVNMDDNYAMSHTYNLLAPKINSINFLKENRFTATQLTVFTSTITHDNNGVGGYSVDFVTKLSDDLKDKNISQIKVMARTVNSETDIIWVEPILITNDIPNGTLSYRLRLDSSYAINQNHELRITNWSNINNTIHSHFIAMDNTIDIVFFVDNTIVPTIDTSIAGPFPTYYNSMNAVAHQTISLQLGYRVEEIYNGTDIVFSDQVYSNYGVTTYSTYDSDIYYKDVNGAPVYNVINGILNLSIQHNLGDWIFQETIDGTESLIIHIANSIDATHIDIPNASTVTIGQGVSGVSITPGTKVLNINNNTITLDTPITTSITNTDILIGSLVVLHNMNDPILDNQGQGIIAEGRTVLYHVDMIHIDAKLSISDMLEHANYLSYLTTDLNSYLNTINTTKQQLIENTDLYFKPIKTLGTGRFKLSEQSEIVIPLGISVKFKYYITSQTLLNLPLLEAIRVTTLSVIDSHIKKEVFSCTAIVEEIKTKVGTDIKHIDVLGINGDINLQTLMSIDSNTKPNLSQVLSLDQIGKIQLTRALYIEYVTI